MIQIWSLSSTDTPMVWPSSQWFGNGFGHRGSTSNRGAWTHAASTAARFCNMLLAANSNASTTTNSKPMHKLRLTLHPSWDRVNIISHSLYTNMRFLHFQDSVAYP